MQTIRYFQDFLLKAEHDVEEYLLSDDKIDIVYAMPWIICSAMIWALLSKLFNSQPETRYYVSSLHSVLVAFLGMVNLTLGHNEFEHYTFYILAGYFLADFFITCLKREFYVYALHHLLTVGATYRMINGRNWNETLFASSCWLLELSTPFLNHYKVHRTARSALIFAVVYFFVRVLWLGRLSYLGFGVAINRLEFLIIILFTALNYYWFFDIVRLGLRMKNKKTKKSEQKEDGEPVSERTTEIVLVVNSEDGDCSGVVERVSKSNKS